MKRLSFFTFFIFCCVSLFAQQKLSFSVLEFEQDVFDTSAKSAEHGKKDGNGSWYAIIKVTSNNPDDDITACQFNFGNMASKVEKHDEALWVYVQRNAKKVTISRPGYHTISQYDLQTTIEAGAVYKMVLTSDRVRQQVVYDVKMQMVKFQTSPAVQGAMVMVTNLSTGKKESIGITGSNGAVSKALDFGKYSYEVMSSDNLYYPSEGLITLNNSEDVLTEKVVLRPNFADVSLSVDADASIYINNELKGNGRWNGRLSPGVYIVVCKKANHLDSQQRIVVEEGKPQIVTLSAPKPIVGTLVINTSPTDATIAIDGKLYGKSPKIIKGVLIGSHEVSLSYEGYQTAQRNIVIEEGKTSNIEVELQKEVIVPTLNQPRKDNDVKDQVLISEKNSNTQLLKNITSNIMGVEGYPLLSTSKQEGLNICRRSFKVSSVNEYSGEMEVHMHGSDNPSFRKLNYLGLSLYYARYINKNDKYIHIFYEFDVDNNDNRLVKENEVISDFSQLGINLYLKYSDKEGFNHYEGSKDGVTYQLHSLKIWEKDRIRIDVVWGD